jgi:hypothetical protein
VTGSWKASSASAIAANCSCRRSVPAVTRHLDEPAGVPVAVMAEIVLPALRRHHVLVMAGMALRVGEDRVGVAVPELLGVVAVDQHAYE